MTVASATIHHFQACCTRPPSPHFGLYNFWSKWPAACLVVMTYRWRSCIFVRYSFVCQSHFHHGPLPPLHPRPVYGPVALQSTTSFFSFFNILKNKKYMQLESLSAALTNRFPHFEQQTFFIWIWIMFKLKYSGLWRDELELELTSSFIFHCLITSCTHRCAPSSFFD